MCDFSETLGLNYAACVPKSDVLDGLGRQSCWCLPELHGWNQRVLHRVRRRPLAQRDHSWWPLAVLDRSLQRPHWEGRLQGGPEECSHGGAAPPVRYRCLQSETEWLINEQFETLCPKMSQMSKSWLRVIFHKLVLDNLFRMTCTGTTGPEWGFSKLQKVVPRAMSWLLAG